MSNWISCDSFLHPSRLHSAARRSAVNITYQPVFELQPTTTVLSVREKQDGQKLVRFGSDSTIKIRIMFKIRVKVRTTTG